MTYQLPDTRNKCRASCSEILQTVGSLKFAISVIRNVEFCSYKSEILPRGSSSSGAMLRIGELITSLTHMISMISKLISYPLASCKTGGSQKRVAPLGSFAMRLRSMVVIMVPHKQSHFIQIVAMSQWNRSLIDYQLTMLFVPSQYVAILLFNSRFKSS